MQEEWKYLDTTGNERDLEDLPGDPCREDLIMHPAIHRTIHEVLAQWVCHSPKQTFSSLQSFHRNS